MEVVEFRPDVYRRCGKDIVRFVCEEKDGTQEMVSDSLY
jgi:hypothetical protein